MPETMATVDFSVADHHVALAAPRELTDDITTRLAPYLTVGPTAGIAKWTVQCGVDPSIDPLGAQRVVLSSPTEPQAVLWVDHETHLIIIDRSTPPSFASHFAARYLRILLRLCLAESPDELFAHAGMVARSDRSGFVVLGPKRAGKTSTLLSAVISGAVFVGNDDVSIAWTGTGWIGRGWPRSISVRLDTFDALGLPSANVVAAASGHPSQGSSTTIGAMMLLPGELTELLSAPAVRASAPVAALVFPQFTDESPPILRPLSREDALRRLLDELLPEPVKQADFLLPHFNLVSQTTAAELCDRLTAEVPAFELRQNFRDLRAGSAHLSALLD
ncbi:hypothetical protein [Nocardia sp. NPDC050412]|uniref:hypothetical protein n=1 Tax=Nocardia sp. NPDC050412 TaxID=3364320 RepID=UPI00378896B8